MNNLMDINLAILGRVQQGAVLTAAEIDELATSDVLSLGMLADEVRRERIGDRVTFVRVHEWAPDQAVPPAAKEVRLTTLPETVEAATAAIETAQAAAAGRRVTGFSLADVFERGQSGWGSVVNILKRLKAAGLDGIVHAPLDTLPDALLAIRATLQAGLALGCLSVQRSMGSSRTDVLVHMRTLASEFPEVTTVAPLPRVQTTAAPTTGYDDVRTVALARLVVPSPTHIQVDWSQYGPKLAQVALTFGADDLDRVSAIDDESLGRRRLAAEDVKRNITAAGFVAVERDSRA